VELIAQPGTYALILRSRSKARTQVGRWGWLDIEPGYYIYVGSAFGPGGVRARVARHCRATKRKHWHIDYLREFLSPIGAWYSHETTRLEHRWAQAFHDMDCTSSVQGFGCSDCKCRSHLFNTRAEPDLALFSVIVGGQVRAWPVDVPLRDIGE
jgi:Uri superfamily endonuclease